MFLRWLESLGIVLAWLGATSAAVLGLYKLWNPAPKEPVAMDDESVKRIAEAAVAATPAAAVPPVDLPARGAALWFTLIAGAPARGRENYVLDFRDAHGTRVSLYLDPGGAMVFRVTSPSLYPQGELVEVLPGLATFEFRRKLYIVCSYGSRNDEGFMRVTIDGKLVGYRRTSRPLPPFDWDQSTQAIGGDLDNNNHGAFEIPTEGYRGPPAIGHSAMSLSAEEERTAFQKMLTRWGNTQPREEDAAPF